MPIFLVGFLILCEITVFFFIGCFALIYYWHETKMTIIILPVLYTFYFFLAGFAILSLVFVLIGFGPNILGLINSSF